MIKLTFFLNCQVGMVTPLHAACMKGHLPVVKALVLRGANISSTNEVIMMNFLREGQLTTTSIEPFLMWGFV